MTKAATDVGDIFSLHFQCSSDDGTTWNDRAVFPNILGNIAPTPTATAPITRRMVISQIRDIASTDSSYTPSGSADGVALTGGQRIDGPFPPISRESGVRKANWRWSIVQTDANANADFRGTLNVYAVSEYER